MGKISRLRLRTVIDESVKSGVAPEELAVLLQEQLSESTGNHQSITIRKPSAALPAKPKSARKKS